MLLAIHTEDDPMTTPTLASGCVPACSSPAFRKIR